MTTSCPSLRRFALVCVLGPLAGAASGQQPADDDTAETLGSLRPPEIVPATPFAWGMDQRGTVDYELGSGGGWHYWPPVLQWRYLPWVTSDPLVEVIVYTPYSGSPDYNERFKFQFPVGAPVQETALVIAFHSWNVSEQQIFNPANIELAQQCTEKGWMLLAPYGLNQVNFGNEPSQAALEAILALVETFFDFNHDKIYTLGFSMGGINAASFAFRHQDPTQERIAGVIYHTGSTDAVRSYVESAPSVQGIFESAAVFGGSPTQVPFNYDRINPARFLAPIYDTFDEAFTNVNGILDTPWYLFLNMSDQSKLVGWTIDLKNYMEAKGAADLTTVFTFTGGDDHHLSTMSFKNALDWAATKELGPLPTSAEILADRPAKYLYTELLAAPAQTLSRYDVSVDAPSNDFSITDTHAVDELGFDLALMGLDPAFLLTFTSGSGDGTADTYVLQGYPTAPSSVLANGNPPAAWSHDAISAELSITPTADGSSASVQVIP
ncbi:MAG: hypothetical protein O7B99_05765 [Planctomycetota bacterium]|nr:hypothetical protein [Planctomycetota bacterium]